MKIESPTMPLTAVAQTLEDEGFILLRNFLTPADLAPVYDDIHALTQAFAEGIGLSGDAVHVDGTGEIDRGLVRLVQAKPELQPTLYARLQLMPHLLGLPSHPKIQALASAVLEAPAIGVWPRVQLRFDRCEDEQNTIGWHHDYLYNGETDASYTFWMPIVGITPDMGMLLFARDSHKLTDVQFTQGTGERRFNYTLPQETLDRFEIIQHDGYQPGDLVVFHSRFIHSGTVNQVKDRARLTALFRMQDLKRLEAFS